MIKGFALRPPLLKELLRRIEARTCAISVCVGSFAVYRVDKNGYRPQEHHYNKRTLLLTHDIYNKIIHLSMIDYFENHRISDTGWTDCYQ